MSADATFELASRPLPPDETAGSIATAGEGSKLALQLVEVSKRFGAIHALSRINLQIASGERHVLLGTNGAGKTTLFNLIAGDFAPSDGNLSLFGTALGTLPTFRRAQLGIARTYQSSAVFDGLSVSDHLVLATAGITGRQWNLRPLAHAGVERQRAKEDALKVGLGDKLDVLVNTLSHGQRRQLEIGMALAQTPRLLLLDEPAAGLSPSERPMLIELIRALPRDITLLMIEHDMDVAMLVADHVTVMKDGVVVAHGTPDAVRNNPLVKAIYLGVNEVAHG